jgi:hypothetical protein
MKPSVIVSALLASSALAAPQAQPRCYDLMLDVPASATNIDVGLGIIDTDDKVADWVVNSDRWDAIPAAERAIRNVSINDTFSTYAQLCLPNPRNDKKVMQILTHGGGFDHRYCMCVQDM